MINIISSERIKYRRTFIRHIMLLAPLFFVVIEALLQIFSMYHIDYINIWNLFLNQVFNWWTVIFIPLGIALFAALVASQEKKTGNYRNLRVHNISPSIIWTGKVVLMAYHTMLSTLVFIIAIIISGLITAGGEIPWIKVFTGGFMVWLTSLAIIPLQLWVATWKGTFFSMAVGFVGLIANVIAAPKWYWVYVPWSWPTRLMCPIIGVHPNGAPLKSSDFLMNSSVIPKGIVLSLVTLIIVTIITSTWFTRREAR